MQDTQVVDEQVVDVPPETPPEAPDPQPEPQPEWAQRFDNPDTMWKSYREAERAKTQAEQRAAELERQQAEYAQQQEQWSDPFDALPPTIDQGTQEQLATWAQRDPAAAAKWAYENHHTVGPEVAGQLYQYWASQDFWGAENWKAAIINQQYYAQMEEKIRSEFEPVRQHTTKQMSELTLSLAQQMIPDWDQWSHRIADFLNEQDESGKRVNQVWLDHLNAAGISSDLAAERLYDLYGMLHTRDQRARGRANPAPAPPPDPSAHTETSSTSQPRDDAGKYASKTTTTPSSGRRTGRLDHL